MKNIIIPGFSANKLIFEDFLKRIPNFITLENVTNTYDEARKQLDEISLHEKINIFGWSLGSLFALKYSLEKPENVSSLFLTGATARFTEKGNYTNGISQTALEKMSKLIIRRKELVMNDFYNTILEKTPDKEKYFEILVKNTGTEKSLSDGLKELKNIDLLDKVQNIRIPVLIYQGKYDKTTPLAGAEILKNHIAGSKLFVYEGGHCFFLERPETCAEKLKEFLCQTIR
jgi:pimeloyl-[acyl-carrier protein] methyl ester esterase